MSLTIRLVEFRLGSRTKVRDPRCSCWRAGRRSEKLRLPGETSIDNRLPVHWKTLFVLGSVTKTYTATALMCLVTQGLVKLDTPMCRHVSDPQLANEQATTEIIVLNLPNRTADWIGD